MSHNIYIQTEGPESWKTYLAEPVKQWKTGFSAKSLAYSWEDQNNFPTTFKKPLKEAGLDLEMLLGIPEFKVNLDTNKAPSQNDLFVLCKNETGLITLMIEGKVSESFDKLVKEWNNDTPSRTNRLQFLLKKLEVNKTTKEIENYRYQLFHRTASAIITAEDYFAKKAIMIVHSFSQSHEWFNDYSKFISLLNPSITNPQINKIYDCKTLSSGIELHVGWIKGDKKFLTK